MQFSATQARAMLQATGQEATIDDGSLSGLDLYCKFTDPQRIVSEFSASVEMTEPQAKVATVDVEDLMITGLRGLRFYTGGSDYQVKTYEQRSGGFTILMLEDV